MSENSAIPWTHHTFNIAWGCTQVSPGCAHCYAQGLAERHGLELWSPGSNERRTFGAAYWNAPIKWNRRAEELGVRHRVFCASMADVFEDHPTIAAEREKLWPLIESTPSLDWLVLTKRAERIRANLPANWGQGYANVWLGVSVENQRWTTRVHELAEIPAVVRFLSCEPLLGPIDLSPWIASETPQLDWVIAGGESGPNRRDMELEWFGSIARQCASAGVPFFAKQDCAYRPDQKGRIPDGFWRRQFPSPNR